MESVQRIFNIFNTEMSSYVAILRSENNVKDFKTITLNQTLKQYLRDFLKIRVFINDQCSILMR